MESDLQHLHYHLHEHHQKQTNSGLTRYQSAPSSYFSGFLDGGGGGGGGGGGDEFLNRPPSPETERIFEQFLQSTEELTEQMEIKIEEEEEPPAAAAQAPSLDKQSTYQGFYQRQLHNEKPGLDPGPSRGLVMGYGARTGGTERFPPPMAKVGGSGGGGGSNLIRHSSSPAGLFDTINIENGYVAMRGMGDFGGKNPNREASFASKPPPSPSRLMAPMPEMGNKANFSSSWDKSSALSNKGLTNDRRTLSGGSNLSEIKNVEGVNRPPRLSHHLSLPKSFSEMSEVEKLLQLSDSVPCKIRAKRGCATHPRSIAERVRRTKISERMKKLQDLVPNMDKQTNTADMLDLAVDYIKDLQERVKILKEDRARCTCSTA